MRINVAVVSFSLLNLMYNVNQCFVILPLHYKIQLQFQILQLLYLKENSMFIPYKVD